MTRIRLYLVLSLLTLFCCTQRSLASTPLNSLTEALFAEPAAPLPAVPLTAAIQGTSSCGTNSGAVSVYASGGTTPYTYSWQGTGAGATNVSVALGASITGLAPGTYSVTVTDHNGAQASASTAIVTVTPNLSANHDTTICAGSSVQMLATGSNLYSWSPATGLSDANIANPVATPTVTTTYTVTSYTNTGDLVFNGDFTAGNAGFTSSYGYVSPGDNFVASGLGLYPEGLYAVDTNANVYHPQFFGHGHDTGHDNYMIINGAPDPDVVVWSETVNNILPNTNYYFSTWVSSMNLIASYANLKFSINGNLIGPMIASPVDTNHWIQFYAVWNSGSSTSAQISIVNENTIRFGNDFGLDDITFTTVCPASTQVTVNVNPTPSVNAGPDQSICLGTSATLTATGAGQGDTYLWSTGATTASITVTPTETTTYSVTLTNSSACSSSDDVTVSLPVIPLSVTATSNPVNCYGEGSGSVSALAVGGAGGYHYLWSTGDTVSHVSNLHSDIYYLTVTDAAGCQITAADTVIEPGALFAYCTGQSGSCTYGNNTASISIRLLSGFGYAESITYAWSNGDTTNMPTLTNLPGGTYTVTITNSAGCTTSCSSTVTVQPVPTVAVDTLTNEKCFGGLTGSISVSANGGTPAYNYAWDNGATGATAANLAAGTYTVIVTDVNGCMDTVAATITEPTAVSATITNTTDVPCFGNTTGTATVTADGGTPGYTYLWVGGQTTATATGLGAGTYNVTVTDANGCVGNTAATINGPTAGVTATITNTTDVLCFGRATGTATVTAGGGNGSYTYLWDNGRTTAAITGLAAGTYTVTVTDGNGCAASTSATINGPSSPVTATTSATDVSCFGLTNGTATVIPAGGTGAYTYIWDGGATTISISGLGAGTYGVTVTDANGCRNTASATVTAPANTLAATITNSTDVSCFGGADGTATVTATGGTSPYTYLWVNGQTTQTATGLAVGLYGVTVTDAHGCATICNTAIIYGPAAPVSATYININPVLCFGDSTGSATAVATGGTPPYTYHWSDGQTTQTGINLPVGTYHITVTDAHGCLGYCHGGVQITGPAAPVAAIATGSTILCFGDQSGTASVTATGGTAPYTYLWTGGATTSSISGLAAGTYNVTVTDANGCAKTASATVNGPAAPVSATASATDILCYGATTGTATVTPNGGTGAYTYLWTGGATTASISALGAGTYSVTVTDANGCAYTTSTTVNGPATQVSATASATDILCFGATTGTATVTPNGGTGAYTYLWTGGQTTVSISGLGAGTYSVTVTDANGCASTASATVNGPATGLTATATGSSIACFGDQSGTVSVTPQGGTAPYTYLWDGGATTASISGLGAGTYNVTVTDAGGCTSNASASVTGPAAAVSATTTGSNLLCYGATTGTASVTPAGGTAPYTYLWTGGATTASISALGAGTYSVTVTDANGCAYTASADVTGPQSLVSATASATDILCFGATTGTATVTPNGGTGAYTYLWTGGQTTATATGLAAGIYGVTVTDANGCVTTSSATVNGPTQLTASTTNTNTTCSATGSGTATVTPAGGTAPYTYLWDGGQTTATATGLTTGTYGVTVTDANGCATASSATVSGPTSAPQASASATDILCYGATTGTATVTASSGTGTYTYLWDNGQTTATATGLAAGTYSVTVTDGNSCQASTTATVNGPAAAVSATASATDVLCYGATTGTATVVPTGGTGAYTYLWTGSATTASISGLAAGSYSVTVTDANGCATTSSATVNGPQAPFVVTCTPDDGTCANNKIASITTSVTGGTAVSYAWDNGAATASISGLTAGTYNVTVTDANGCMSNCGSTVAIVSCCIMTDGGQIGVDQSNCGPFTPDTIRSIVTPTGGVGAIEYLWLWNTVNVPNYGNNGWTVIPGANGPNYAPGLVSQTTYFLRCSRRHGCPNFLGGESNNVAIIVNAVPTAAISLVTDVNCATNNTGAITASATGGTAPYTYTWDNGATGAAITGLAAGAYTVSAADANGCIATATDTLACHSFNLSVIPSHVTCNGLGNGSITLTVIGGTSPYTFLWNDGTTTQNRTGLSGGTFSVTVTDAHGLVASTSTTINEPAPCMVDVTGTNLACNSGNSGTTNAAASGGTPPYSYLWNDGATTQSRSGLAAGTYSVTEMDVNQCASNGSVTLTEPAAIVASSTSTDVACNGGANGAISTTVSGGTTPYSYLWNDNNTNANRTGLAAGTYSAVVTDANGCVANILDTVAEPMSLRAHVCVINSTCNGGNTGSAVAASSGGTAPYTYLWSNGATTMNISSLASGPYTVTVTDANGCMQSATGTVINTTPIIVVSNDTAICAGGSAQLSASGADLYSWSPADGLSNTTIANPIATPTATTTYTVNTTTHTGNLVANGDFSLGNGGFTSGYGFESAGANAAANGGGLYPEGLYAVDSNANNYHPDFFGHDHTTGNGNFMIINGAVQPNVVVWSETVNNIVPNTDYYFSTWISSMNDISAYADLDFRINGNPIGPIISSPADTNHWVQFTATWNSGASTTANIAIVNQDIIAGGNDFGLDDISFITGCQISKQVTVTVNPIPVAEAGPDQNVCGSGSSATLTATGAGANGTYLWSTGATTASTSVSPTATTTYSVTVTTAAGCSSSDTVTVHISSNPLTATASSTALNCFGQSTAAASVSVTGGTAPFTYLWTGGATIDNISGLAAGTYSVTVTDALGCQSTSSTTVVNPTAASATASATDILCYGATTGTASVTPAGGTGIYTYLWTGGATTASISGLAAGTYSVTVTDGNGCAATSAATVNGPAAAVSATASATDILCFGNTTGTATVVPAGGTGAYTYLWTGGQTTATATGLAVGTYGVTVTDANGCVATSSATVNGPAALTATASATDILCYGATTGTATVVPTGGTGAYTYLWTGGQTTASISALGAGTYSVTVTDANGCAATSAATVNGPSAAVSATATATDILCYGATTGTASVTATGGTGAYTYLWTGGQTTASISALGAGTYSVTVTDANGCAGTSSATVNGPAAAVSATATATDILCYGATTGTATVTPAGGTGAYTYLWTGGQNTASISGLGAGTYSVTVTDANGCATSTSATVNGPASALTATTSNTNATCSAPTSGTATVVPTGGTGAYTYLWTGGQTTATATGLAVGTYGVTVTDANGCVTTSLATVTGPASAPLASATATDILCYGATTGTATVTASSGDGNYSYLWTGGQTTATATGLGAGTYGVTVTDGNGCQASATATVNGPAAAVAATATATDVLCYGASTGTASVTATGGTGAYTYLWTGGATTASINGLGAGTYGVTVTDANGCANATSATVNGPAAPLAATTNKTDIVCATGSTGTATVNATGGTGAYTYLWDGGQTTQTATALAIGTYGVTVTDANACVTTSSATIGGPVSPITASSVATNVSCNGGANGTITTTVSGGIPSYTYLWNDGSTDANRTALAAGAYVVTVTDAKGCTAIVNDTVTQPLQPVHAHVCVINSTCNGGNTGSAVAASSGGTAPYTYLWSNGATTMNIANLATGPYTVTVTDANGCAQSATGNVINTTPNIVVSNDTAICAGGSAQLSASGADLYSWSPADGLSNTTIANPIATPTATTTYIVTTTTHTGNLVANGDFSLGNGGFTSGYEYVSAADNAATAGGNMGLWPEGTYGVDSNANNYHPYFFGHDHTSGHGNFMIINGAVAPNKVVWAETVNNIVPNTDYYFSTWISSQNDISAYANLDFRINGNPIGPIISSPVDTNHWVQFTATWNSGNSTTANIAIVNQDTEPNGNDFGLDDISFITGCSISKPVTVTVNPLPVANAGPDQKLCGAGASATLTATGAGVNGTYHWNTGANTASIVVTPSATTSYSVTVTTAAGCSSSDDVTVTISTNPLTASASSTALNCFGQSSATASVTVTGGTAPFTYLWTGGATTASISGLAAGTYSVTVSDALGCQSTSSTTVVNPVVVSASASATNILCYGATTGTATVVPAGGTGIYTYLWTGGATTASINGLAAGTYGVTVTDGNGCAATSAATVNGPAAPVAATATGSSLLCYGATTGTASVSANGGTAPYSYLWTGGATTASISGLAAGTYSVTVSDANGCAVVKSATVTGPAAPVAATATGSSLLCYGATTGTASVSANGGTAPYSYLWTGGATTASISGLAVGTYSVTVSDANGCAVVKSATVTGPANPVAATATGSSLLCYGTTTGTASVSATGGTSPYTYLWTGGATTASISGLAAGTYSVTVSDANGCAVVKSAIVTGPAAPVAATATGSSLLCYGATTGTASVSATGGTSPYTYLWTGGRTTASISGLAAGTYSVTVRDANGCNIVKSAIVTGPATPVAATISCSSILCYGATTATATVTASGGTPGYTYKWSNNQTTATATGLGAGSYNVTVTDANGCNVVKTTVVNGPANPVAATITCAHVLCYGATTGTATVVASGGTPGYTYKWSNNQTTATATGLGAGNYTVTVTDANGCAVVKSTTVNGPANPLAATISCSNIGCFGGTATATVSVSGGTPNYTIHWSNNQITATATGLIAGNYSVTITDANGCNIVKTTVVTGPSAALNATIAGVNPTCNGGTNGSVTATPSAGTAPYTYKWNNNATTAGLTNIGAGTYTVTVTDAGGCTKVVSKTLTQPSAITVTLTCSNSTCPGSNNGSINTSVSGGSAPYTYLWSNGQTGANLVNAAAGPYSVTVNDANHCNSVAYGNVTALPGVTPSVTIVPASVSICSGSSVTFTATAVNGGSSPVFTWKKNGTTVGSNSNTYTASSLVNGDIVYVVLTSNAACVSPATATSNRDTAKVVTKITPGTITGSTKVCKGACVTYSVTAVAGATSYTWTLPSGATGSSTTNSINVCFNGSFCGGSLCVKAVSACGTSNSSCLTIQQNTDAPSTPGSITGTLTPCTGSTVTYTVAVVSGATSYDWTLGSGMSILAGAGTNSIIVKFSNNFSSGNICVKATNCAGTSCGSSCICVRTSVPAPSCVTGPATVCINGSYTYTAGAVSGATSYTWTVPANVSIVSGQGTATLVVKYLTGFSSGSIAVVANTPCGSSTSVDIDVHSGPSAPTCINGPSSVCSNYCNTSTTQTFTVSSVSGVTYTWSVPSGVTIVSGQGTATLKVRWGSYGGDVCVTASNSCGTSTRICKSVCIVHCKEDGTTDNSTTDDNSALTAATIGDVAAADQTKFEAYPNPAHDLVAISFHAIGEEKFNLQIFDAAGLLVNTVTGTSVNGKNTVNVNVGEYARGMYIVNLLVNEKQQQLKLSKQ